MIKHEKKKKKKSEKKQHIIDNTAKISENSNGFLRSLVKCLKIKLLHPLRRSMRKLSIKMRNLKVLKMIFLTSNHRDFSSRQHSEAVAWRCSTKCSTRCP